ncbi:DNA adenine methylase [Limnohabitans sp. T6-5]|uniref:DNA adenine methylase n=1 Tax=Limnohabitans sp. T6-5 TaxID=1100724 RepID=UPI001304FC18|nr:DNA adenine methylase [Limnohabitans sp. T6-5]
MKYMGSKRAMLTNGLGHLIEEKTKDRRRFVDLFCGSGAVSSFVAQRTELPVLASDLQKYATTLTEAVICRTKGFDLQKVHDVWYREASNWIHEDPAFLKEVLALGQQPTNGPESIEWIGRTRVIAELSSPRYPITRAYGGYYYSIQQALAIDALRATVNKKNRATKLAALISAASSCAAAPGHTAQPFSTTETSLPHLLNAWRKDVFLETTQALNKLSTTWAKVRGEVKQKNALDVTENLNDGDLVFVDPPYSEVQYSRFYHVLETVVTGKAITAEGSGRYPPITQRPQSAFCLLTKSIDEFDRLMLGIAAQGAHSIVTFPAGVASNGLSGEIVEALSAQYFKVKKREVASVFSTLGGNKSNRNARQGTNELILYLVPI